MVFMVRISSGDLLTLCSVSKSCSGIFFTVTRSCRSTPTLWYSNPGLKSFSSARWSLSGDMLAVLSSDGIEQHVDIIRLNDASLVERVTRSMRAAEFDHLSIGSGTVAWAPDGHTIAFVAKEGPRDQILLWSLYDKELGQTLAMPDLELIESLAWAPESRELAFIGTGSGQSDLYTINADTGERRQITGTPQLMASNT